MSVIGRRTDRGFTLLELLVVLCVMGLLSAAGAAVLTGGEGRQMKRSALAVSELLKTARRNALTSGAVQWVEINKNRVSFAGLDSIPRHQGKMTIRLRAAERQGAHPSGIAFCPDGSSTGGVIEMSVPGVTHRIEVDWLSRVDVFD